jgi:peptidoglycan-associated lipoprotein
MKATRFTTLMALGIALTFVAAGCKTHPQNMKPIYGTNPMTPEVSSAPAIIPQPQPPLPPGPEITSSNIPMSELPNHPGWAENAEQFKADTIHFAYDSSVVKTGDKSKISDVASYLKNNPLLAVRVEGNCDERGTEEYNRSLGERRALAAREELVREGIAAERVDTISYGEDKPVETGHNEAAWKQNRRDDFILLTPPGK